MYTSCPTENKIALHSENKLMDWYNRHFSSLVYLPQHHNVYYIVWILLYSRFMQRSYQWSGPQKFNQFWVPRSFEVVIDCVSRSQYFFRNLPEQ